MSTTHTKEHIEQKEKQKEILLLDEINLRDYFAAKALQGLVSAWGGHDVTDFHELAQDSYAMADAMLKARKGGAA